MLRRFHRSTTIIPVDTLPNASDYKGQLAYYPRWPMVGSLPATVVDGQRWRIAEAGQQFGREYLGRNVVELSGPDHFQLISATSDLINNDWRVSFAFRDVTAGVITAGRLIADFSNNLSFEVSQSVIDIRCDENGFPCAGFKNAGYVGFGSTECSDINICDGNFHVISLEKKNGMAYFEVDSVGVAPFDLTGWSPDTFSCIEIADYYSDLRPLQIVNIQQSLNGVLVDNIPCTETTGTELANTANPLRPATLSDASAHALAWVPQDSVTMGVWQSDGSEWVPL